MAVYGRVNFSHRADRCERNRKGGEDMEESRRNSRQGRFCRTYLQTMDPFQAAEAGKYQD